MKLTTLITIKETLEKRLEQISTDLTESAEMLKCDYDKEFTDFLYQKRKEALKDLSEVQNALDDLMSHDFV